MGIRDIIFRGKRVDTGEWVYGYLCDCFDFKGVYHPAVQEFECAPKYEVNPETVGQYTGLNVNGNKIFEGDIIKIVGHTSCYAQVIYSKVTTSYWVMNKNFEYGAELSSIKFSFIEVAGNVIDNPELLEVE